MQAGKADVQFRFDAEHPDHPEVACLPDGVLKQCGLAHPGLPTHKQCSAHAQPRTLQQALDGRNFLLAAHQLVLSRGAARRFQADPSLAAAYRAATTAAIASLRTKD